MLGKWAFFLPKIDYFFQAIIARIMIFSGYCKLRYILTENLKYIEKFTIKAGETEDFIEMLRI